ncbi:hypothetical protein OQX63_17300 [Pedobacter sp. PF22-3]|uniref:hypothetical protein n=1 Tax=Pedobacter sp. PF22-3 TaxID=2994467 RepID=UPI002246C209|nr:hypothetical protein [Pedobacter sp. PF22-3]MCX2495250.1 hypothetical protein [Pedobacter sp. PF22-3]
MMKNNKKQISEADIEEFDMLQPMLKSVYVEISELSKKKQDGSLNSAKVKIINRLLVKVQNVLRNEPMIELLDLLDDDALPSNSDATLIIAQYTTAMKHFKDKYYDTEDEVWDFD